MSFLPKMQGMRLHGWWSDATLRRRIFILGLSISLRVVFEAAGAYKYLQARRTTRRTTKAASSPLTSRFGPREASGKHTEQDDDGEEYDDDSDSDEDEIQLDDDDSDGDDLRDEILLLGTASDEG